MKSKLQRFKNVHECPDRINVLCYYTTIIHECRDLREVGKCPRSYL